jgi:hypothetical protein
MRFEWRYSFTSKSLRFETVAKYEITFQRGNPDSSETIKGIIEIRPNPPEKNKETASGILIISIPFSIKEGTPIAHCIANDFVQKMAFEFGDFQINWAVLACERIPETDEEIEEVGELTHHILRIALEIVPEKQIFNPELINGSGLPDYNPVLLRLFNNAESKKDIIDKYLTRFKIIETEFIDNSSREPAKKQLRNSAKLYNLFKSSVPSELANRQFFENLIDSLVDARGKCAHLKKYNYGYLPDDQRLNDFKILEYDLREFCRALIRNSPAKEKRKRPDYSA